MNIGIFGGTFNPPHHGHLIVAARAREVIGLDRILLIPSAISPHKQDQEVIEPGHRLEMLRLATFRHDWFELSEIEIGRGGVSYTVDTLSELKHRRPDDAFSLLIGMDNLVEFEEWKSPGDILRLAEVIVMTRPGFEMRRVPENLREKVSICRVPEIGISSTEIRHRVRNGMSISFLVPREVEEYIHEKKLYR